MSFIVRFIKNLAIVHYGAAIYYEIGTCINGGWFEFDVKVSLSLLLANTFLIIYFQLKG
jgi:hypothetical protein